MDNTSAPILSSTSARQRAERMRAMDEAERRRFAMKAANEYDAASLFNLLEGHLGDNGTPSDNTLRTYRYALARLVSAFQDAGVNMLKAGHRDGVTIRDRLKRSKDNPDGLSAASVRTVLSAGRALYGALEDAGATKAQPFARVKQKDNTRARAKRQPYKRDAFKALRDAAQGDDERLLLLLGGHAGLRASELVSLTWKDVHVDSRDLKVLGKGDVEDVVPMSKELHDALASVKAARKPRQDDTVLSYGYTKKARRALKALCQRAGVTYLGLHSLRHYAGTSLHQKGRELLEISHHLRHAQVETSAIYAEYDDSRLREAVWQWEA